jgi:hypothetical protein
VRRGAGARRGVRLDSSTAVVNRLVFVNGERDGRGSNSRYRRGRVLRQPAGGGKVSHRLTFCGECGHAPTFAFVSYAASDLLTYRHAVHLGRQEIRRQRLADANVKDNLTKPGDPEVSSPWRLTRWVTPASVFRAIFDFVVPVLVAIYALGVLWGATHTAIQPKPVPPPATAPASHK